MAAERTGWVWGWSGLDTLTCVGRLRERQKKQERLLGFGMNKLPLVSQLVRGRAMLTPRSGSRPHSTHFFFSGDCRIEAQCYGSPSPPSHIIPTPSAGVWLTPWTLGCTRYRCQREQRERSLGCVAKRVPAGGLGSDRDLYLCPAPSYFPTVLTM